MRSTYVGICARVVVDEAFPAERILSFLSRGDFVGHTQVYVETQFLASTCASFAELGIEEASAC